MRINCHVPVTVRVYGEPTQAQLDALGAALTRTVAARLARAQRVLAERRHEMLAQPPHEQPPREQPPREQAPREQAPYGREPEA
ncbi:hypothetical protein ACRYCC_33070 [Actinomadura scrupuli]|uniref:hypothetical protein n=1 Tax=Actinomadura scrupuli TaxID=559629 RepID=UPI003D96DFC6